MNQIIKLSADVRELLVSLARINDALENAQDNAEEVGQKLESSSLSAKSAVDRVSEGFEGLKDAAAAVGATFGGVVSGLVVGVGTISHSLESLSEGLKNSLHIQSSGYQVAASRLSSLTNGMLDLQSSSEFIRKGQGMGMTDEQINKIVQMGANLGLVSREFSSVTATQKIFEAVSGAAAGSIDDLSTSLSNAVERNLELAGGQSFLAKQQVIINTLMEKFGDVMRETGNASESSMGRLLGVISQIKSQAAGLLPVFQGLGGVAAGVLGPLAGGVGLGALAGGPFGALLGGTIGTIVSGALAGAVFKIGSMMANDSKGDLATKLSVYSSLVTQMASGALMTALTGEARVIPKSLMEEAVKAGIDPKQIESMGEKFVQGAALLRGFGMNFQKGFSENLDKNLFDKLPGFKNLKSPIDRLGYAIGSMSATIVNHVPSMAKVITATLPVIADGIEGLSIALNPNKLVNETRKNYGLPERDAGMIDSYRALLGTGPESNELIAEFTQLEDMFKHDFSMRGLLDRLKIEQAKALHTEQTDDDIAQAKAINLARTRLESGMLDQTQMRDVMNGLLFAMEKLNNNLEVQNNKR